MNIGFREARRANLTSFILIFAGSVVAALLFSTNATAGGWYLMGPPTQADLDPSCLPNAWPGWHDCYTALRCWESVSKARKLRCVRESLIDAPAAPLSRLVRMQPPGSGPGLWVSAFSALKECEKARSGSIASKPAEGALTPLLKDSRHLVSEYIVDPALKKAPPAAQLPGPAAGAAPIVKGFGKPKEAYFGNEEQSRQATRAFLREHRNDDRAATFAALMENAVNQRAHAARPLVCVASDDPRLLRK